MLTHGSDLLVDRLDLVSAVRDEASWQPDLLPVPIVNEYAQSAVEDVAAFVSEIGRGGLAPEPAEVLAASKWRYGRRPVMLLPFVERVLYRGVVDLLSADLPRPSINDSAAYSAFVRAPLGAAAKYVIITDLANFYSSIPTVRLCDELLERTGQWRPVEWLREFWLAVSAGNPGIPQVSQPSDQVAEVYAHELHCRLLRRGVEVWQYSDDFRIAARSLSAAFEALEAFDEEARALGLFVNERKTYIVKRRRYESILKENEARVNMFLEEAREDLTEIDIYHFETVDPDEAEVLHSAALRGLAKWRDEERGSNARGQDVTREIEVAKLVRWALAVLAAVDEPEGIYYCREILVSEPQLTPQVVRYLESLAGIRPELVVPVVRSISLSTPLTKWQQLWIASLVASSRLAPAVGNEEVVAWLEGCCAATSEILRSQAVWSLACNWSLKRETWSQVSRLATKLGSPYLSASLNEVEGMKSDEASKLAGTSKLDRWVYEWASSRIPSLPF